MPIIRTRRKRHNFTIIDNTGLLDSSLSWKATGLLAFLMTKPDDWQVSLENLTHSKRDGQDSTISALEELKKAGYLYCKRYRIQGRFESEYLVFETRDDLDEWLKEQDFSETEAEAVPQTTTRENPQRLMRKFSITTREKPQRFSHSGKSLVVDLYKELLITDQEITDQEITEKSLSPTSLAADPQPERERILKVNEKPKTKEATREEPSDPISELSQPEREEFVKFGVQKANSLPTPPTLVTKWIAANFTELYRIFLASTDGKKARERSTEKRYDFANLPNLRELLDHILRGGFLWTQEVEAEREWRTAFFNWAYESEALANYADEVAA